MLGLLLIYWIGNYFYKLARKYKQNEWGYALTGIAVYYVGGFVFVFLIGAIAEIISPGSVDQVSDLVFSLLGVPFGLGSCYFFYVYLERKWEKRRLAETDLTKHLVE